MRNALSTECRGYFAGAAFFRFAPDDDFAERGFFALRVLFAISNSPRNHYG
jgi:hypothetical protein